MQPAAGPWRVVRAAFVAAVCVSCSAVAHVLAGGAVPGALTLAGAFCAFAALAYALSGARWTFGRLLLVLGLGQVVLHPVFDLTGAAGAAGESVTMVVAHCAAGVVLAAGMAHGDLVLWRLAAVVQELLRPLVGIPYLVGVVPPAAPGVRTAPADTLVAVPVGVVPTPSGERAPPVRS